MAELFFLEFLKTIFYPSSQRVFLTATATTATEAIFLRKIFRFYLPNRDILLIFANANTKPE
jgi:hypothetical protein